MATSDEESDATSQTCVGCIMCKEQEVVGGGRGLLSLRLHLLIMVLDLELKKMVMMTVNRLKAKERRER